jgi:DivIVA domain-containing protein
MAISFSRPDPSSPAAVADAAFGTARRGFDQQEVRDFLRMVAAEMARLQERERFLERELRAVQTLGPSDAVMDEDTATRLLGEEAARLLQTAREGGAAIRVKAEDGAARLLRDAADEAQRMREEADLEASRRRTDAAADAEAELAMAKQQGREMVEEARAYRERVLTELSRRRELARQQIEQLIHGRDRLLQAFERARGAANEVIAEITPLAEPDAYVDLSPTTGPVPIMVPAGSLGDASSIDDTVLGARAMAEPETEPDDVAGEPDPDPDPEPEVAVEVEVEVVEVVAEPIEEPADAEATVLTFPSTVDTGDDEIDDDDDLTATDIDDLFARLRANRPDDATADELTGDDDAGDAEPAIETPFRRRDAALVPLIVASARKLKRILADEQNEVLDALRSREPVVDVDRLLPAPADQADRYAEAITVEMIDAVEAGAASVGGVPIDLGPEGPLAPVRAQLAAELVGPLRERLERNIADGDGDNDTIAKRARGVYREWKTQRIDEQLDDLFRLAFCQGAMAAIPAGSRVVWEVDPDGPPSPDCEDNALGGAVTIGHAFPSGHTSPPMHAGCRCLLALVDE